MSEIWFSSDHHFHHFNIIRYADRPFKTVKEMNDHMVELHNKWVKPQDHWYCLGDVTMERDNRGYGLQVLKRMNGHKRLILENHDHYAMKHYLEYFEKVMAMNVLDRMRFTHIPVHPLSMGGVLANVHGHIHQTPSPEPVIRVNKETQEVTVRPYINICVEQTGYQPVSLDWIRKQVKAASD